MTDTATAEPTTTPASEPASTTPGGEGSGAGNDGSGSGSQDSAADAFAAEKVRLEQLARDRQSEADKLRKENAELKSAAASTTTPQPLTLEQMRSEQKRWRELDAAATALRKDEAVKFADPSLFDRADEFDSVESFRVAVEDSHRSIKGRLDGLELVPKSDVEAKLARYVEKYGALESPPSTEGAQPTGAITVDEIGAMSFAERDVYDQEHPGEIARVLRSANAKE